MQTATLTGNQWADRPHESGDGGPQAGGEVFGATARRASDVRDTVGNVTEEDNASRRSGGATLTSTTASDGAGA